MKKVLVANRGEIALRIMKTVRKMGISCVAVYSEADANAPFVKYADESILLGPAPSAQSYLLGEKIIEKATAIGVDGIHPGYGFLSENAGFAKAVTDAGITFIGPSPESMEVMGSKLSAKEAVKAYDIPLVPGTEGAIEDVQEAKMKAERIGFPVLIKASAGGGGKGMRIVEHVDDFESQMDRAVSEAISSFGDGKVFVEKFVTKPRHIEIQILADTAGNVVHLHERECSIQRRHQKVVEEAPSVVLTKELRAQMGASACDVARSCNYVGAGTVEFLLDADLNYYFLEMNTRLQVEHPVSEMITGIDMVEQQIRIAKGEKLSFSQAQIALNGHAIEIRVYAEDPLNKFLPDIGKLAVYIRPEGKGVRVDDGFEEGMNIPIYYDPMIAKLIVHAENRLTAIAKMTQAIEDYQIHGIETTLDFCKFAINHKAFVSGDFDTNFVKEHYDPETLKEGSKDQKLAGALVMEALSKSPNNFKIEDPKSSPWVLNRR